MDHNRSSQDRAAVVTIAVLQIFDTAPCGRLRESLEEYLRNELSDVERQVAADRELPDA